MGSDATHGESRGARYRLGRCGRPPRLRGLGRAGGRRRGNTLNGEIWERWSTRTGNLMEEFATEAAARVAVAEIVAEFGPAYLDAVVLLRGPISGEGDRQPVASGAALVALTRQEQTNADRSTPTSMQRTDDEPGTREREATALPPRPDRSALTDPRARHPVSPAPDPPRRGRKVRRPRFARVGAMLWARVAVPASESQSAPAPSPTRLRQQRVLSHRALPAGAHTAVARPPACAPAADS
jgi:hypothetical protein